MPESVMERSNREANGTLSGFILGITGWVTLQTAAGLLHARLAVHLFLVVQGALMMGVAFSRYRRGVLSQQKESSGLGAWFRNTRSEGWVATLVTVLAGYGMGWSLFSQSALFAGIYALGIAFAPWHRLPSLTRRSKTSALLFFCAAILPFMTAAKHSPAPITLLVSGWAIMVAACAAFLRSTSKRQI